MITMKDVAREAGVSVHSVSAVLNGNAKRYRISQATSERIQAKAVQLGYDPDDNRGARQLAARKYGTRILHDIIAVCTVPGPLPLHEQPFESMILSGIESMADEHDLDVLQCRLRPSHVPRWIEKGEVDGVIMLSSNVEHFQVVKQFNLPVVAIGSAYPLTHNVSAGHYQGTYFSTSHLLSLGHRCIGYIGHDTLLGPEESALTDAAVQRLAGFQAAMSEVSSTLAFVDTSLRDSFPSEGEQAFERLWQQSGGALTGIVCYNDTLAIGAVAAATKLGLQVPGDLSVVGFDNISRHFELAPQITSISFDRHLMGSRSVEIILKMREQNSESVMGYIRDELPVRLVEAQTTTVPRT